MRYTKIARKRRQEIECEEPEGKSDLLKSHGGNYSTSIHECIKRGKIQTSETCRARGTRSHDSNVEKYKYAQQRKIYLIKYLRNFLRNLDWIGPSKCMSSGSKRNKQRERHKKRNKIENNNKISSRNCVCARQKKGDPPNEWKCTLPNETLNSIALRGLAYENHFTQANTFKYRKIPWYATINTKCWNESNFHYLMLLFVFAVERELVAFECKLRWKHL